MNRESNHNPALIQPVDKSSAISTELRCSSLITSLCLEGVSTTWNRRYRRLQYNIDTYFGIILQKWSNTVDYKRVKAFP
jgi:hypothetical protein